MPDKFSDGFRRKLGNPLTEKELLTRLALDSKHSEAIVIQPTPQALSADFISLHVHDSFLEVSSRDNYRRIQTSRYEVQPQHFVLGVTQEIIKLPIDVCGAVDGKNELSGLGLVVHCPGVVDPGFVGQVIFELHNYRDTPITLSEGMSVAKLTFYKADGTPLRQHETQSLIMNISEDSAIRANIFSVRDDDVPVALDATNQRLLFYPCAVSPIEVEYLEALRELEYMIADPKLSERDLQSLFCSFPYLLTGPDYTEIRSQVVLSLSDGGSLRPDFFLQPIDQCQLWEIADIKLPKFRTVVHQRHRKRLSASVMEGIAQLRTYSRYFDDADNRNRIKRLHGIAAYKPRLILVIGRAERNLSPFAWRDIEDQAVGVKLLNYDQVVELARNRLLNPLRR